MAHTTHKYQEWKQPLNYEIQIGIYERQSIILNGSDSSVSAVKLVLRVLSADLLLREEPESFRAPVLWAEDLALGGPSVDSRASGVETAPDHPQPPLSP